MICLVSGGLDSLALWRHLDFPPAVHFLLGTEPEPCETAHIDRFATAHGATVQHVPLPMPDTLPNGFLPHRNALMILAAMQRDPVVAVAQVAEWGPDKNQRFFRRLERLAAQATTGDAFFDRRQTRPRIVTPFAAWSKGRILADYLRRYASSDILTHSWSCYHAGTIHCGQCWGCVSRYGAEATANLRGTVYRQQPAAAPVRPGQWRDGVRWLVANGPLLTLQQLPARWRDHTNSVR